MAEVLITLGIIGVVAAITMPVIITGVEKNIARNQFKKTYSMLTNAFNMTIQKNGGIYCTQENYGAEFRSAVCKDFWDSFMQELKVAKYCTNNAYANGCVPDYKEVDFPWTNGCGGFYSGQIKNSKPAALLNDGTIIFPYSYNGSFYPAIGFDINGFKGPNQGGKDVFSLGIASKGNTPVLGAWNNGSLSYCLPMAQGGYWFGYLSDVLAK